MAILGSKTHTVGDTKRWTVDYSDWLDNTATIKTINVTSSSLTCTVSTVPLILGQEIILFLTGGVLNEQLTLALTMTDSLGNIKHDTIAFTVVAA